MDGGILQVLEMLSSRLDADAKLLERIAQRQAESHSWLMTEVVALAEVTRDLRQLVTRIGDQGTR